MQVIPVSDRPPTIKGSHPRHFPVRVETFHHVQRAPGGPTAWFGAGYCLSRQALEILVRYKWRIPDDIAVRGFVDPFAAATMHPPLTTTRHPVKSLGELAATRLLDAVREGKPSPSSEILTVELVVRKATAPPRSAAQPVHAEVLATERERAERRTPYGSTELCYHV